MKKSNLPIRISISEASKLFGISTKTIHKAISANEVLYIVVRGRYKLNFASVLKWSQSSTRRRNQLAYYGIGKYVKGWDITNQKYSPDPKLLEQDNEE